LKRNHIKRVLNLKKNLKKMKKILKKIEWWFDYYIDWMMYSPRKQDRYIDYMEQKWGKNEK
jgi:hypothetical protein